MESKIGASLDSSSCSIFILSNTYLSGLWSKTKFRNFSNPKQGKLTNIILYIGISIKPDNVQLVMIFMMQKFIGYGKDQNFTLELILVIH